MFWAQSATRSYITADRRGEKAAAQNIQLWSKATATRYSHKGKLVYKGRRGLIVTVINF